MGEDQTSNRTIPLISLAELKALGKLVSSEDLPSAIADLSEDLPPAYPLFPTRMKPDKWIDVFLQGRWEKVEFIGIDSARIRVKRGTQVQEFPLDDPWEDRKFGQYCIAPAGTYTAYLGDLSRIETVRPSNGVTPTAPLYNSPIAISHRWLGKSHPDPDGIHFTELLRVCQELRLLDCQTFFVDYCCLPQLRRTPEEDSIFRTQLREANRYYQRATIVLAEATDDYETRAWCMFEMLLASVRNVILNQDAVEGKLKAAFDLARSFVDASIADFDAKKSFGIRPGASFSGRQLQDWLHGSMGLNRVYFEMRHRKRASMLSLFRDQCLKSSDPSDIPMIEELLGELL